MKRVVEEEEEEALPVPLPIPINYIQWKPIGRKSYQRYNRRYLKTKTPSLILHTEDLTLILSRAEVLAKFLVLRTLSTPYLPAELLQDIVATLVALSCWCQLCGGELGEGGMGAMHECGDCRIRGLIACQACVQPCLKCDYYPCTDEEISLQSISCQFGHKTYCQNCSRQEERKCVTCRRVFVRCDQLSYGNMTTSYLCFGCFTTLRKGKIVIYDK